MNLHELVQRWSAFVDRRWTTHLEKIAVMSGPDAGRSRIDALDVLHGVALPETLVVRGSSCREMLAPLVPFVESLVADIEDSATELSPLTPLRACELVNALQVSGYQISEATVATIASWLPKLPFTRDDEFVHYYWEVGFAALAFGARDVYHRIAGYHVDGVIPFSGPQRFQFNMHGLLGHLSGAVEMGARADLVMTAWRDVLACYTELRRAEVLDAPDLVWIARIIHHRIAGQPLAEVADFLHTSVAEVVAAYAHATA